MAWSTRPPTKLLPTCGWDSLQRRRQHHQHHETSKDTLRRDWRQIPNSRTATVTQDYSFPAPFSNRSYDNTFHVWNKIIFDDREAFVFGFSNKNHVLGAAPAALTTPNNNDHNNGTTSTGSSVLIPATCEGVYLIESLAPRVSRVTVIQQSDVGGSIPSWVMHKMLTSSFSLLLETQEKLGRTNRIVDKVIRFCFLCVLSFCLSSPLHLILSFLPFSILLY